MASIKLKFKQSTLKGHKGTIYYQIIHDRRVKQLFTRYHLYNNEWDEHKSSVNIIADIVRTAFLQSVREKIRWDMEYLYKIIHQFEQRALPYTVDDVANEFERYNRECALFNFMENLIAKLSQNGKARTSETYRAALNSFKKFRKNEDIMLHQITSDLMCAYEDINAV